MSLDAESKGLEVVEKFRKYVSPGIAGILSFSGFDLPADRSEGCYVYDVSGRKFLDCVGGYGAFSLGHLHPAVVEAVKEQLSKEALKTQFFMSSELADACEALASVLPGKLQYSFLCNSGTEAVEGALKCARIHTGRTNFVSAKNGFHGKSLGSLSVSGREIYKQAFYPLLPGTQLVDFGDIDALDAAVDKNTAAVILEIVQGEAGVNLASNEYFQAVREICDKKGAMFIADEVRTGFGRTGKMFACEHPGVVPDIITMAKALGGGVMPVGSFSAGPEIWDSMFGQNPYLHSTTFGGNPLACVAVSAAIRVTVEQNLVQRSAELGNKMHARLKIMQEKHSDMVKEVRGIGLLAGIEFAEEDIASLVIAACGRRDLLVAYSLNNPKVIRVEPPLIIEEQELDRAIDIIAESVEETAQMLSEL